MALLCALKSEFNVCVWRAVAILQAKLEQTRRNKRKRKGLGSGAPKEDETRHSSP